MNFSNFLRKDYEKRRKVKKNSQPGYMEIALFNLMMNPSGIWSLEFEGLIKEVSKSRKMKLIL